MNSQTVTRECDGACAVTASYRIVALREADGRCAGCGREITVPAPSAAFHPGHDVRTMFRTYPRTGQAATYLFCRSCDTVRPDAVPAVGGVR